MRDTANMSYAMRGASPLRDNSRSRSPVRMMGVSGGQGIDPYRGEGGSQEMIVHMAPPVVGPSAQAAVQMAHNATRAANESRHTLNIARAEITGLKENLAAAEKALAQSVNQRDMLARENESKESAILDMDAQMRMRSKDALARDTMYSQLQAELMDKNRQQEGVLHQTQMKLNGLQREITHREDEIADLRQRIHQREMQCDAALVSDTLNRGNNDKLKTELELKN